jgi:hypothetical protein
MRYGWANTRYHVAFPPQSGRLGRIIAFHIIHSTHPPHCGIYNCIILITISLVPARIMPNSDLTDVIPITRSIQDHANGLHRLLYALLARTRCVPDVQTSLRDTSEAGKASRRPSSNAAKSPANVLDPCEQQESSLLHVRLCSENGPVPGSTSRSPRSPLVTDVSRCHGPRAPDETADCR